MSIRKDAETPATSLHFIKTIAGQLTGLQTVINRLAQASESLLEKAVVNGSLDPEIEARLTRHAELQSDLLAEYSSMFSELGEGASRVLLEMMRLALANPKDLYDENGDRIPIHELPDDVAATISDVSVVTRKDGSKRYKYKQWDKPRALSLVGKHFGLLREVIEHSGPGGGPIKINASMRPIPLDALDAEDQIAMLEILERAERKRIERGGSGERIINAESRLLPERVPSAESNAESAATTPLARRNVIPKPRAAPMPVED